MVTAELVLRINAGMFPRLHLLAHSEINKVRARGYKTATAEGEALFQKALLSASYANTRDTRFESSLYFRRRSNLEIHTKWE